MRLILSYTVQLVIPNVCTKFQNPKSSSFREIFDRKKVNKHAHTQTEKTKTIYPLYTSYAGGINIDYLLTSLYADKVRVVRAHQALWNVMLTSSVN